MTPKAFSVSFPMTHFQGYCNLVHHNLALTEHVAVLKGRVQQPPGTEQTGGSA